MIYTIFKQLIAPSVYAQSQIWVLPVQTGFIVRGVNNMKTRELSVGEKQAIVKLRKDGKSMRAIAQTLATIWNVLKKKETTGVLRNRH